jgi:hypothetical protein
VSRELVHLDASLSENYCSLDRNGIFYASICNTNTTSIILLGRESRITALWSLQAITVQLALHAVMLSDSFMQDCFMPPMTPTIRTSTSFRFRDARCNARSSNMRSWYFSLFSTSLQPMFGFGDRKVQRWFGSEVQKDDVHRDC